jgi:bifunctional non-homologous end joining protein LigD
VAAIPEYEPQLATLVESPPEGDGWLHEVKFDGYRIGCRVDRGKLALISRKGNDWTRDFPEVRAAAAKLRVRTALIDGEVAVVLADGRTSFQALQTALAGGDRSGLTYFVFDLLHLDGRDLRSAPLAERKSALASILPRGSLLKLAEHWSGGGPRVFGEACRLGFEGLVSKRRDAPYRPGRSTDWLKTKCSRRQEFVVGGFTDSQQGKDRIGALLVGHRDDRGNLIFAGKVGTGYTGAIARDLRRRLEPLRQRETPFVRRPEGWLGRGAHWVRPELVAEVAFTEWTRDGKVRHPSFQGLREDKRPRAVVRERPRVEVADVAISHPERVVFPDAGITKLDLARYYEWIGKRMVPHVAGRPLTLVRCPGAIGDACVFMKHSKVWAPPALRRIRIPEKTKLGEYLVADSVAALVSLAQMDVIEIHTWNTRAEHVEQPDRIVLDVDPGPQVTWRQVVDAARLLRRAAGALGLESWVKTTGGLGLHVVIPIVPERDWSECLAFARGLAEAIERDNPRLYTTRFPKAGREAKILLDYLRNNRTNTSIAAFSTRARPGAPVSVPVAWSELTDRLDPLRLTVRTLPSRLKRLRGDPWAGYFASRQRLTGERLRAAAAASAPAAIRKRA